MWITSKERRFSDLRDCLSFYIFSARKPFDTANHGLMNRQVELVLLASHHRSAKLQQQYFKVASLNDSQGAQALNVPSADVWILLKNMSAAAVQI